MDRRAIRDVLEFYLAAGVDAALAEAPADRFAEDISATAVPHLKPEAVERGGAAAGREASLRPGGALLPPEPDRLPDLAASRTTARARPRPPAGEGAVMAAREAAGRARSLDELRDILAAFDGCSLRLTARQLVFADGDPAAPVMFVGEAPGREEDERGLPFVGRSGKLLDRMLAAIGLDRSNVYIANIVPWRPPGNRTPTPQETEICKPFVQRQIELAGPRVLVCLGGPAAQALVSLKDGILKARGRWFGFTTGEGREIPTLATLHPAYLLRQPLAKRLAWRDFLSLKARLDRKDD